MARHNDRERPRAPRPDRPLSSFDRLSRTLVDLQFEVQGGGRVSSAIPPSPTPSMPRPNPTRPAPVGPSWRRTRSSWGIPTAKPPTRQESTKVRQHEDAHLASPRPALVAPFSRTDLTRRPPRLSVRRQARHDQAARARATGGPQGRAAAPEGGERGCAPGDTRAPKGGEAGARHQALRKGPQGGEPEAPSNPTCRRGLVQS